MGTPENTSGGSVFRLHGDGRILGAWRFVADQAGLDALLDPPGDRRPVDRHVRSRSERTDRRTTVDCAVGRVRRSIRSSGDRPAPEDVVRRHREASAGPLAHGRSRQQAITSKARGTAARAGDPVDEPTADKSPIRRASQTSSMGTRERPIDRGRRLSRLDRERMGAEIRDARHRLGMSLAVAAKAAGMSAAQAGRIERAESAAVRLEHIVRLGAAVGLDVRMRAYPGPDPIRDAGQTAVFKRLLPHLHPRTRLQTEVPLAGHDDQRAWDGMIVGLLDAAGDERSLPTEVETRLTDGQAQIRRITMKLRDAGMDRVLVVVADTRRNREALRELAPLLVDGFPVTSRQALASLRAGRLPDGSAIVLL